MNAAQRCSILAAVFLIACNPAPKDPAYPSSSSGSYGSTYSAPSAPSGPGVPAREQVTAGIVVRPDLVCLPFAIHALDTDADKAVALAQGLASELAQKLKAIAPTGAIRMRGVAVSPTSGKMKADEKDAPVFALVADGAFEVAMPESMDYWARSKLVAAFVAASRKEADARKDQPLKISFEAPNMRVTDPEVFRGKLTKQWVERAKAFAEAAQSSTSPLLLVDCAAPGEIAQRHVSNEEVSLTLSVSCRLDSRASK